MRILVAEDDFASRLLLDALLLRWGYEVIPANDGAEAWELLRAETAPAIAIVDWMMPKISGVELCRLVRGQKRDLAPYILMLTAKGQKSDVSEGLDAGADDYLVKPFDLAELGARLRVARRSIDLQRELIDSRKAVIYQAEHDVSTGALNRGAVLGALGNFLATGRPLSIALIGIDDHKRLQQTEGAESAEAAVRELVQRVRAHAPEAVLGRYGSDELLVLFPELPLDAAFERADKTRADVASAAFAASVGVAGKLSTSTGLAQWDGQVSLELLLCYADTALYSARAVGDAVDVFDLQTAPAGATG